MDTAQSKEDNGMKIVPLGNIVQALYAGLVMEPKLKHLREYHFHSVEHTPDNFIIWLQEPKTGKLKDLKFPFNL